jgi:hypothetical protein
VGAVELRTAKAADLDQVAALDDSFTTDTVLEVVATPEGFTLRPTPVDPPLHKVFPPDDDPGGTVFVAADGPRVGRSPSHRDTGGAASAGRWWSTPAPTVASTAR